MPIFLFFTTLFLFQQCTDFITPSIEGETVVLTSPQDQLLTSDRNVTFDWDEISGAENYTLRVVKNTFESPEKLVIDSLFHTPQSYTHFFELGQYQWRVAVSGGGETIYSETRSFHIDSSHTTQRVYLSTPADQFITNEAPISFTWQSDDDVLDFRFEVRQESTQGSLVLAHFTDSLSTTQHLPEGHFYWGVQNQGTPGAYSEFAYRSITVDHTPPASLAILEPQENATLQTFPFDIQWETTNSPSTLSAEFDSLFLFSVSSLDTVLIVQEQVNTTSLTYRIDSLASGTYQLRVQRHDFAKNKGAAAFRTFSRE